MGWRHVHAVRRQFRPRPDTPLVILLVVVGGGFSLSSSSGSPN